MEFTRYFYNLKRGIGKVELLENEELFSSLFSSLDNK